MWPTARPRTRPGDIEKFRAYTQSWLRPAADAESGRFQVWEGDAGPPSHSIPPHLVAKAAATLGDGEFRRMSDRLFEAYFRKCGELLKPDGAMLIQAITIADQRYDEYRKSVDFIQRYIFPGSGLPSSAIMTETVAYHTDMRLLGLEDIGLHYARTLRCWRDHFFEKIESIRGQGFPETFIRMWEYYLCYCEAAFLERAISDVQIVFAKPENRLDLL